MHQIGEIAAVLTALCWSFSSILFTQSSRSLGSGTVNRVRLWLALFFLLVLHIIFYGRIFPIDAGYDRIFWLGLSGLIGYIAGDSMLFEAFVMIGPRISMLIMTLVPIISAGLAWIFLGESLKPMEIMAIFLTMSGIGLVVGEKKNHDHQQKKHFALGILLGIGGAVGQAVGLILARKGLYGQFPPISANLIRVSAASLGFLLISLGRGEIAAHLRKLKDKPALRQIFGAALLGPVTGVVLSLYAISHTQIGVASTLMSLSTLFLLPISRVVFKERISLRALIGTLIAFAASSSFFFL